MKEACSLQELVDTSLPSDVYDQLKTWRVVSSPAIAAAARIYVCAPASSSSSSSSSADALVKEASELVQFFVSSVPDEAARAKTAATEAPIYLALTDVPKKRAVPGQPFNEQHINTGLTLFPSKESSSNTEATILIYRKQEWKKVLIHELFHWSGLQAAASEDGSTPIILTYASGTSSRSKTQRPDWTEAVVEMSASAVYQDWLHRSSTQIWKERYAKLAAEHLRSMISLLLRTSGPEKDQQGPGYLLLKYAFWASVGSSADGGRGATTWLRDKIWKTGLNGTKIPPREFQTIAPWLFSATWQEDLFSSGLDEPKVWRLEIEEEEESASTSTMGGGGINRSQRRKRKRFISSSHSRSRRLKYLRHRSSKRTLFL